MCEEESHLQLSTIKIDRCSPDITELKNMYHTAGLPIQHVNLRRGQESEPMYIVQFRQTAYQSRGDVQIINNLPLELPIPREHMTPTDLQRESTVPLD